MNFLDKKEREEIQARHRLEKDGKIRDRIKTVLLSDKGWSCEKIAEALLISERSIRNHISEYARSKKVDQVVEDAVVAFALEKPAYGQMSSMRRHLEKKSTLA